jgi:prepilin-type N-terminal cleavage/methylation domain-containing protein
LLEIIQKPWLEVIMHSHPGHRHGFTLIELLIVVAIVGILSTIAIPNFYGMQKRAKSCEARSNLDAVWQLQEAYRVEYATYTKPSFELSPGVYDGTNGWPELGFFPKGSTRYEYEIISANQASFVARAKGNIDNDNDKDVWMINEMGALTHIESD